MSVVYCTTGSIGKAAVFLLSSSLINYKKKKDYDTFLLSFTL